MESEIEGATTLAIEAFRKAIPNQQSSRIDVEEIEEDQETGHFIVTLGYWAKDDMPELSTREIGDAILKGKKVRVPEFLNPWRRKYKRVEIDAKRRKVVSIKMYGPPLGVS